MQGAQRIIPLEAMLTGRVDWQTGLFRIVNTGAGGAMALAGSLLLWPTFEAGTLLPMTAATMRAMARYARGPFPDRPGFDR